MKRMGMVIGIKPERIAEYKRTHAAVWPEVLAKIADCNIKNYTIFLREPENLLFAYFEYHGQDYAADAAKMAADKRTQDWWAIHDPMQVGLELRAKASGGRRPRKCSTPTERGGASWQRSSVSRTLSPKSCHFSAPSSRPGWAQLHRLIPRRACQARASKG